MKGRLREIFLWTHLCVGLCIALGMLAIAGSGLVLATQPAVMARVEAPWARVTVPTGARRLSLDGLAAKALQQSGAEAVSGFTLQRNPEASLKLQLGRERMVYQDPYTGAVLGEGAVGWQAFYREAEDLHRWFLVTGKFREVSHQVKSAINAAFLLMILSGLLLWVPQAWNGINLKKAAVPNFRAKGKARDLNWHQVAGLWASPFILVISLSGLVMSYGGPPAPPKPAAKPEAQGMHKHEHPKELSLSLEATVKAADGAVPGWIALTYRQPKPGQDTASLMLQTQDTPPPRGRGILTLKAATGAVDSWQPFEDQIPVKRLRGWARWAHTGQAFGPLGELLVGLACLAVLLLVYTGLAMSWRRFFGDSRG